MENPYLPLGQVSFTFGDVFPAGGSSQTFYESGTWEHPITYFVGRNGSGKSRTAKLVAESFSGRILSTDRLAGLTLYSNYGYMSVPNNENNRGIPLGAQEKTQAEDASIKSGIGVAEMYALRDNPDVLLRVAAFLRRALGRIIDIRENAGFLDPYIRVGRTEYSLLRDEGHGLRELVILLAAAYREDWTLLVVDEPELHLHPSMTRLWLSELEKVCKGTNRRAIVVTHEPSVIKPKSADDLGAIWLFSAGRASSSLLTHIPAGQEHRVTSSLVSNPQLVSQLVFAPRPVLVEGVTDVAALTTALARTHATEVVAQTDFIECGGSGFVALWYEISRSAGIDVRAVADLDACLSSEVQRAMDSNIDVVSSYQTQLGQEPPYTHLVLRPLLDLMNREAVPTSPKDRSSWLAAEIPTESGYEARFNILLEIWRRSDLWLHRQGTLEDVLGITSKSREAAQKAAAIPGPIDDVAAWCAFSLDPAGDVRLLLEAALERIAHTMMEAIRSTPEQVLVAPVGPTAISDLRLVDVTHLGDSRYRLTVKKPETFAGFYLDFSRSTPSDQLTLMPKAE
ncbi:ATP-dependent endonuclease [Rathayibacter sp. VKM Ac-2928]|uniref:ATP-dependent nuclease n=1 Tax=Rathayibacter sp. VKM Ac-2928 TaxID=2929479 RepID=UPI001FB543E3|nr:AAA family ATPase [Rathayibacter sp. VKM Ac-2928]MCJ1683270.1 ATP-binding protein [Rathayibacter sp. VKM Ac-2928]